MYPVLFKIGSLTIYSWGLLFSVAVLICTWLALRQARKEKLDPDQILNLIILIVVGGLVGARLFYIFIYEPGYYMANPLAVFQIWNGGLVWYGGVIGGVMAAVLYIKKAGLPFWQLGDLLTPYAALGYGIVRIGCFLNGCCYGKVTAGPFGVIFPHLDDLTRYPTQIFSSLFGFALFFLLLYLRRLESFKGEILLWGALFYAAGRGFIESYRENLIVWQVEIAGKVWGITISQLVGALVIIIAGGLLIWRRRGKANVPG